MPATAPPMSDGRNQPPPRYTPSPVYPRVNNVPRQTQWAALDAVLRLESYTELVKFARDLQERKDAKADAEWRQYRLTESKNGVIHIKTGSVHEGDLSGDAIRFPGPDPDDHFDDQQFCDKVNANLRNLAPTPRECFRLTTKHYMIWQRLREVR